MSKKECRIVERTAPDKSIQFVIQQKHFLFKWIWVDAAINSWHPYCRDSFNDLKTAEDNLCYFDGTPTTDKVILTTK